MIKELVKELEGQVMCLVLNTEKYITFSVPMQKNALREKSPHTEFFLVRIFL